MKIGIAADHGGYEKKKEIIGYLKNKGYEIIDYGPYELDPNDDYPIFTFDLCEDIKNIDFGILLCRSGIGVCIAANKVKGIRCAKIDSLNEAKHSRLDNDANVLSLNADKDLNEMYDLIEMFIKTPFSHEERHIRRIDLIDKYNNKF